MKLFYFGAIQNKCNKTREEQVDDISQQVHSTNCKLIKQQCLELKQCRDCREVLLDLSEDAAFVQKNATENQNVDSEATRIAKAAKYGKLKLVSLDI